MISALILQFKDNDTGGWWEPLTYLSALRVVWAGGAAGGLPRATLPEARERAWGVGEPCAPRALHQVHYTCFLIKASAPCSVVL